MRTNESHRVLVRVAVMLAIAVAGGCLGSPGQQAASEKSAPSDGWSTTERYRYDVHMSNHSAVGDATKSGLFDFEFKGRLEVTPVSVSGATTRLLLSFSQVEFVAAEDEQIRKRLDGVARELQSPQSFTYLEGRMTEARLGKNLEAISVGILRNLAASFQLPPSAPGAATVEEYDATGRYVAEYTKGSGKESLRKRKLRYVALIMDTKLSTAGFGGDMAAPVFKDSSGEITRRAGVVEHVRSSESLEFALLATGTITSTTALELTLKGREPAAGFDLATLDARTERIAADVPYRSNTAAFDFTSTKIGGRTFDEVIKTLEALASTRASGNLTALKQGEPVAPGKQDAGRTWIAAHSGAVTALGAMLGSQPERVAQAAALVKAGSSAKSAIIVALGAAASLPAQQALLDLMRDPRLSAETHKAAAFALIRTKRPDVSSAHALEGLLDDPILGQHAVLGLGTFARLFGDAGLHVEQARIGKLLLARLASVSTPAARSDVFSGLSNSGYPGMIESLATYYDDASEDTRRSAVQAIRLVQRTEVAAVVIRKLNDEATSVRSAALQVARNLEPSRALDHALIASAQRDAAESVRMAALELLVSRTERSPELRAAIKSVAAKDASDEIRRMAQAALDPHS